jgi:hypothetical protein
VSGPDGTAGHDAQDAPDGHRMVRATVAAARALRSTLWTGDQPLPDLAELTRDLHAVHTVPETLQRVVELAVLAVPGSQHASVTLPGPATAAASDGLARRLDGLQYAAGDGPCLEALVLHAPLRSNDLAVELRWAEFAAAAVRMGVRSVLSCRLALGEEGLGALTLYASPADAFEPASIPLVSAYAAHAAAALARVAQREQVDQLRQAVTSNRMLGTAIGLLMGSRRISEAEAFDLLRALSQDTDRTMRETAADVVEHGGALT